jgi:hypothetical protein
VCTWFARHEVEADPVAMACDLRTGFEFAELVPPDLEI